MPSTSRASQKCLEVFSRRSNQTFTVHLHVHRPPQAGLGQSHRQAGPSCPSTTRRYATVASQIKPKGAAPGPPPKSKRPSKAPAVGKLSSSSVKTSFRNNQVQLQEKMNASKQQKLEDDPAAAAEYMGQAANMQAGIDMWARAAPDILDVGLPVRNNLPWGLNAIKYTWDNARNNIKSAVSTYQLGLNAGFPPLYSVPEFPYEPDVYPPESPAPSEIKWYNPMHLSQLMRFSSTLPTAWLAGIHGLSLCLYLQMCKAIAENDKTTLKKVTCGSQLDHALKVLSNRDPDLIYTWKFVKENTPTRIVSIRAAQVYNARHEPRHGLNRMLVNALVRFDTTQSLEISRKRKQPRGTKASQSADTGASGGNVTQKRVLEYYVIQKRGWTTAPWSIRERIYDTSGLGEKLDGDGDGREKGSRDSVGRGPVSGLSGFMTYLKQRVGGR